MQDLVIVLHGIKSNPIYNNKPTKQHTYPYNKLITGYTVTRLNLGI